MNDSAYDQNNLDDSAIAMMLMVGFYHFDLESFN